MTKGCIWGLEEKNTWGQPKNTNISLITVLERQGRQKYMRIVLELQIY